MKWFLLTVYLLVLACRLWLRHLNLQQLKAHGHEVPAGFEGIVDRELLARTSAYTMATSRVGLIESLFSSLLLLLFLFGGLLEWYDDLILGVTTSFIGQGCLFVLGLLLAQTLLDIPFSLYRTFVIEERFQFNASTPKLWITDLLKSLAIGVVLVSLLTAGSLAPLTYTWQTLKFSVAINAQRLQYTMDATSTASLHSKETHASFALACGKHQASCVSLWLFASGILPSERYFGS